MSIQFRPHHFMCALCFQGRGYSPAFIRNFQNIIELLHQKNDETLIEIVNHTDSICTPCPHRQEEKCATEESIVYLDAQHANALHLHAGMRLTWGEAKQIMAKELTLEKFHQMCATCSWKQYGICEEVIVNFLKVI